MDRFKGYIDENDSSLEAFSRQLYNEFISDDDLLKECKEKGISEQEKYDNIGFFSDIKENRDKEKTIKTYEDCVKNNTFYHVDIVRTRYGFDKKFDALPVYKKYLKYMSSFIYKDFPDKFNNVKWQDLDNKKAKNYISNQYKNKNWIYLYGAINSGRTYLSIAFLNLYLSKHDSKVAFLDCGRRMSELANLFFKDRNDFQDALNALINCDVLILDNFASEAKTTYIRDEIIMPILSSRANNNKITIFTSSFSIALIENLYSLKNKDEAGSIKSKEICNLLKSKVSNDFCVSNISLY
ncbi:MAG: hypothetical protein SOV26_01650 [Candidatus Onthovivens sp.]|nr:hypothetical protein [Candidatus Onthovivens sp.]